MTEHERALQIEQLHELGLALLRQRLRRESPSAVDSEIETRLRQLLLDRDGERRLTKSRDGFLPSAS